MHMRRQFICHAAPQATRAAIISCLRQAADAAFATPLTPRRRHAFFITFRRRRRFRHAAPVFAAMLSPALLIFATFSPICRHHHARRDCR
jgi:hypothetical protein